MESNVFVKIVTFINKDDRTDTVSVVGNEDVTANDFEGYIFGEYVNVTGLWKAIRTAEKNGHSVITTTFHHPVYYND